MGKNYSTSGGRFALNTQSSYRATTRRGEQKLLVCNRFGKPRTNCEVRHSLYASKEKWIKFCKEWWKICKKQDALSDTQFDTEWVTLINMAEECRDSGCISVLDSALRWLQNLKGRKEQWAARYTWRHLTLGVHSTQRSESIHSSIKRFLTAHTLLIELVTKLEEFSLKASDLTGGKAARLALKQISELAGHHPVILQLQKIISPFALDILRS